MKYAAFPPMGSMGAKLIQSSPVHYQRSGLMALGSMSTDAGRRTLVTSSSLAVAINGVLLPFTQQSLDLNLATNWDSTATDYTVAATRAGKDFYLYATSAGRLILSANATVPTGHTAATSRKIGGFHCLCLSVGTIAGHTLTDFLTGDILPPSIWDLIFRPICSPEGMVYAGVADVWVDIYLQSGTGSATRSANGATTTDTRTYWDHADDLAAVGKRMLYDLEFSAIAYGSPEATNISGSADPVTTGGHVDTASKRIISNCGCEDAVGVLWQWVDGGHIYRNHDSVYNGAWSYKSTNGRGSQYTQGADGAVGLLAGGYWNSGSLCGSRSRAAFASRSSASSSVGSRGCARRQA